MQDSVERQLTIKAPIEVVWDALTNPAIVSRWFGDEAEIDLRPGGAIVFGWTKEGYGRFHARIERVEPPHLLAYRWASAAGTPVDDGPSTVVEFRLRAEDDTTELHLVESGFAAMPDGDAHAAENAQGWRSELDELVALVEARVG
jgi:uncharacterized protein YndB with AHSA1/START domain